MAAEDSEASANRSKGFFEPFRAFLATFVGLIHTRLDLISTELEEERERLKEILLLGAISFFCLSLGIVLLTLFFVVIFWDTYAFYVLGGFVLLYLGLGVIVGLIARRKTLSKPRLLSATLSELAKDRDRLRS
jgi:uncharacterized membrane protein YqjE